MARWQKYRAVLEQASVKEDNWENVTYIEPFVDGLVEISLFYGIPY